LLSLFSASNQLPDDETLRALFDRFLLRCHVDNLRREAMPQLLAAGWALESAPPLVSGVTAGGLRALSQRIYDVDLSRVNELYTETVFKVRDLGIGFSDRRAVKVLKLLAASALLCGRARASASDLWVLRYVWDREEQIDPLAALVNGVLKAHAGEPQTHPLAAVPERVDGEELARELEAVERELETGKLSMTALARLRERAGEFSDRAAWVADDAARQYLLERVGKILQRLE
jgi:MoxR-like ATPase